ncbi:hypothetical protein V1260_15415 [Brachybacterium sp. J144]|uniref:hypothetical protein n=1 Tax=Brachybacterium sp. J144 TaxID=3116487 RepID=UPI002E7A1CDD|nr:hypothetical protein [Brachybacterium sp. J144]MEE1652170.1 hypothetical protein [Brachybacterium sp. J144]
MDKSTERGSPSPATGGFDPATVPPYPVIILTGADDPDNVTVDGAPITGTDAYDRALATCAQRATELGGAVRVRGISADGTIWPMVVTSTGELHDLSDHPDSPSRPKGRPLSRRALLIGGAALLLGGGTVAGVLRYRTLTAAVPPPPPPLYPGAGANLPVLPPAGIDTVAQWAVTIEPDATPVQLTDGRIVLITSGGALVILDELTGQLQWTGRSTGRLDTVRELTVADHPVLASYSTSEASFWPLDNPSTPSPQTLALETSNVEALITSGPMPAWVLEPQTVTFLARDVLATVDVPVPAQAAGTHDGMVVAVGPTGWIAITDQNAASTSPLAGIPADYELLQARVLGPDHLASLWVNERGDVATLTLHELPGGDLAAHLEDLEAPSHNDLNEPRRSPDESTWVWGYFVIRPNTETPLAALTGLPGPDPEDDRPGPLEVTALTNLALWGTVDQTPARYDLDTGAITYHDLDAALPVAESTDGTLAYVIATRLDQTSLYALPATSPTASDGGQG